MGKEWLVRTIAWEQAEMAKCVEHDEERSGLGSEAFQYYFLWVYQHIDIQLR